MALVMVFCPSRTTMAKGPTVYCSLTGSDTDGDGSELSPFRTVAHAMDTIHDCGNVRVIGMKYNDGVNTPPKKPRKKRTRKPRKLSAKDLKRTCDELLADVRNKMLEAAAGDEAHERNCDDLCAKLKEALDESQRIEALRRNPCVDG